RIAIKAPGECEITVSQGEAEVIAPSGSQAVIAGQKMIVRGPRNDPEFKIVSAVSFWRKAAFLLRDAVQVGVALSADHSGDDDKPKTPGAAPSDPSPKASPPPQTKAAPLPVMHGPPVRAGTSNKTETN